MPRTTPSPAATSRAPLHGPAGTPSTTIRQGLAKIGLALRHEQWSAGTLHGVSPTQSQILATLAARGPLRPGALATELAVTAPTITDALGALERKGLVRRAAEPGDGRARRITLTARGRRLAHHQPPWPDLLLRALDALSAEEQAVLLRALTKMIRTLQDGGRIAPARMCATCTFFRPFAHRDQERPHHCAFVDAPFGDRALRLDCPDHVPADDPADHAVTDPLSRRSAP